MTPWEQWKARAEVTEGRVMTAAICEICHFALPLNNEEYTGWADVKVCTCGNSVSSNHLSESLFGVDGRRSYIVGLSGYEREVVA